MLQFYLVNTLVFLFLIFFSNNIYADEWDDWLNENVDFVETTEDDEWASFINDGGSKGLGEKSVFSDCIDCVSKENYNKKFDKEYKEISAIMRKYYAQMGKNEREKESREDWNRKWQNAGIPRDIDEKEFKKLVEKTKDIYLNLPPADQEEFLFELAINAFKVESLGDEEANEIGPKINYSSKGVVNLINSLNLKNSPDVGHSSRDGNKFSGMTELERIRNNQKASERYYRDLEKRVRDQKIRDKIERDKSLVGRLMGELDAYE